MQTFVLNIPLHTSIFCNFVKNFAAFTIIDNKGKISNS